MNNPMMMLMNAMKGGKNPMGMLQGMAKGNPQIAQFMQMVNGKSPQQLQQMAQNMAKERGTSVEAIMQQLGISRNSF